MTGFPLDTGILSSLINDRGASPVLERIAEVGQAHLSTSIVVVAEIRYGLIRKNSPRLTASAEQVPGSLDILPFDHPSELAYASVRLSLERRGLPIGANDLLIAAQCRAHDLTLVTHNGREFSLVEDLRIEDRLA